MEEIHMPKNMVAPRHLDIAFVSTVLVFIRDLYIWKTVAASLWHVVTWIIKSFKQGVRITHVGCRSRKLKNSIRRDKQG